MHIITLWEKHFVCRNQNLDITWNLKFTKIKKKKNKKNKLSPNFADIVVPKKISDNKFWINSSVNISVNSGLNACPIFLNQRIKIYVTRSCMLSLFWSDQNGPTGQASQKYKEKCTPPPPTNTSSLEGEEVGVGVS